MLDKGFYMDNWMMWSVLAGAALILEMFSGTFYLMMLALGLAAGGLAALAGVSIALQLVTAAIVGICATYGLRRNKLGKQEKNNAARDPNVNLDIGHVINIEQWETHTDHSHTARAMYRGAMWDVQLEHGAQATPGSFMITEIQGSKLIVKNKNK